jgi:hypothetical protein
MRTNLNASIKIAKHANVPNVSPIINANIVFKLFSGKISPAKIILCPREFKMEEKNAIKNKFLHVEVTIGFASL